MTDFVLRPALNFEIGRTRPTQACCHRTNPVQHVVGSNDRLGWHRAVQGSEFILPFFRGAAIAGSHDDQMLFGTSQRHIKNPQFLSSFPPMNPVQRQHPCQTWKSYLLGFVHDFQSKKSAAIHHHRRRKGAPDFFPDIRHKHNRKFQPFGFVNRHDTNHIVGRTQNGWPRRLIIFLQLLHIRQKSKQPGPRIFAELARVFLQFQQISTTLLSVFQPCAIVVVTCDLKNGFEQIIQRTHARQVPKLIELVQKRAQPDHQRIDVLLRRIKLDRCMKRSRCFRYSGVGIYGVEWKGQANFR